MKILDKTWLLTNNISAISLSLICISTISAELMISPGESKCEKSSELQRRCYTGWKESGWRLFINLDLVMQIQDIIRCEKWWTLVHSQKWCWRKEINSLLCNSLSVCCRILITWHYCRRVKVILCYTMFIHFTKASVVEFGVACKVVDTATV